MKKGQIMIVGTLIAIVLIFIAGISLILFVKQGPGAAKGATYGGAGGAVLGASTAFISSLPTGPGVLVLTPAGAIGGTLLGGGTIASVAEARPQSVLLEQSPRFSSYSFEAIQLGYMVLHTDHEGTPANKKIKRYIYCLDREKEDRCPDNPGEKMKAVLKEKIGGYMGNEDTGRFSYNVTVVGSGEEIMSFEVDNEEGSGEGNGGEKNKERDGEERGGRTVVKLPLSTPTGEEASIHFVFKVGNLQAVAEFRGDKDS